MKRRVLLVVMILTILLMTGCGDKKRTLTCEKSLSESTVKMKQKVDIEFIGDKVNTMSTTIYVTLPESYKSYFNTFKESIEKEYNDKYGKYKGVKLKTVKKSDTELDVIVDFDYKNISSTDKKALNMSGSEKYSDNKKSFEDQGFTCK